jgi:hypothetical protein
MKEEEKIDPQTKMQIKLFAKVLKLARAGHTGNQRSN